MLAEICCEKFHQKKIVFSDTLNVVLGTNTGDNSIGKSTFMLVIDFAFGGTIYAKANDILKIEKRRLVGRAKTGLLPYQRQIDRLDYFIYQIKRIDFGRNGLW